MAVALASPSARGRNDAQRAIIAERQHQAVLRAHAPRLAKRLQRTFEKLRDSFIHSGTKAAGDELALTYSTPDYDAFRRELSQVLQTEYISIGTLAVDAVEAQLGVTLAFDLNERIIRASDIGNRVKGITDDTRDALRNTIQNGIDDGSHPSTIARTLRDQLNGWAGLGDLTRSRAYTIARTETANAYNVGAILGYRESGIIEQVRVIDGTGCGWLTHNDPDTANGKVVSLDEAQANPISHPNCVRAFAPVAAGLEKPAAKQDLASVVDLPGITVSDEFRKGIQRMDPEKANQLVNEMARLQNQFHAEFDLGMTRAGGLRGPAATAIPATGSRRGELTINAASSRWQRGMTGATVSVDSTPAGTIRHEYGHVLMGTARTRMTTDQYAEWTEIKSWFNEAPGRRLSSYALTGQTAAETVAEMFSASMAPGGIIVPRGQEGTAAVPYLRRLRSLLIAAMTR